jgi:hypothetical protein
MINASNILVRHPERWEHFQDLGVDGRIIRRVILNKYGVSVWTGFSWLRWWALAKKVMNLLVP